MLDLEILNQLITFSECGTLSEAAEILHISQPSLSRSMQKLEDELQVTLFERRKNRLTLNETGKIAVSYARKVLDAASLMTTSVQLFDRNQHTVTIGSIAPAPLWKVVPAAYTVFPDLSVSSEIRDETTLLQGLLARDSYQLIILPYELKDPRVDSVFFEKENLMLSVPPTHPLAKKKSITFQDFDGETLLVLNEIGFWEGIHQRMLPHSHFLYQPDEADIRTLVERSNFATFATDLSAARVIRPTSARVNVPITNMEAHASYYCTFKKSRAEALAPLLRYLKIRV
ncbi:MAG: LysR family transcriptional regulator [Anaerovoracaceae bacterium]|jgi:DNA-binding transcriptional LysR family regulator